MKRPKKFTPLNGIFVKGADLTGFLRLSPIVFIPVKTGIQCIREVLDTRLRGYDQLSRSKSILRQVIVGILMIQALCFLPWLQAGAEGEKEKGQKQTHADYTHLAGKWVRPDGGYILELKEIRKDGRLKASYFNPRPINVAKAEWRRMGDRFQVFVELRDVNYPGSTYTLIYFPEKDRLIGTYFQAVEKQTFDIEFVRAK